MMTLESALAMVNRQMESGQKDSDRIHGELAKLYTRVNSFKQDSQWDLLLDLTTQLQARLGRLEQDLIDTSWGEIQRNGSEIERRLREVQISLGKIQQLEVNNEA